MRIGRLLGLGQRQVETLQQAIGIVLQGHHRGRAGLQLQALAMGAGLVRQVRHGQAQLLGQQLRLACAGIG